MPKPETAKPSAPPRPANDNAAAEVQVASKPAPPPPGMGKLVDKFA